MAFQQLSGGVVPNSDDRRSIQDRHPHRQKPSIFIVYFPLLAPVGDGKRLAIKFINC